MPKKEYASTTHDDEKLKHYASKVFSTEGKHDGLYWKTADASRRSPIGPLLADASEEGYTRQAGAPFHRYIFRLLTGGTGLEGRRARCRQGEWGYDRRDHVSWPIRRCTAPRA